jgi:hypothetical protein
VGRGRGEGGVAVAPTDAGLVLSTILRHDAKVTSYKLALIRALNDAVLAFLDVFTVHTVTFRTRFVLLFVTHGHRELVHVRVTAHPTAAWVWRQPVEATARGRRPRDVLRDRDAASGRTFGAEATALGSDTRLTPFRAPRANVIAERVSRTLRQECLDHVLVVNERHLQRVLREDVASCNSDRPRRSPGLVPPPPGASPLRAANGPPVRAVARPVLGGLPHVDRRAA